MKTKENNTLESNRETIRKIDQEIAALFTKRMEAAGKIAVCKKEQGLPVLDSSLERRKLNEIADLVPQELHDSVRQLYSIMFELSRGYQNRLIGTQNELVEEIRNAIETTAQLFPAEAAVACQGVEGANSQIACDKLFRNANIMYFASFDAVFSAVEKGLCRYGIVPLENSTAGSVNAVYDLMQSHRFRIVRSVRVKVDHNLLVKPGTSLSDIREIYSHEQAIAQCSEFLQTLKNVKIVPCENTAIAAKLVAESDRKDLAALSARPCAKLYGLSSLRDSVQNQGNNYTRFICISKNLEIYPGADRTSLMMTLSHEQGALYKVLSRFNALGINLNKLESRPIPDRDFEFRFYFDLDVPVYSPSLLQLIAEMDTICESFTYLGSYSEII
ncbi:MAG: chorismate mutase [Parasporobacterium sp.]|nr:chorismate mutase [Parasporobacterium sp.]